MPAEHVSRTQAPFETALRIDARSGADNPDGHVAAVGHVAKRVVDQVFQGLAQEHRLAEHHGGFFRRFETQVDLAFQGRRHPLAGYFGGESDQVERLLGRAGAGLGRDLGDRQELVGQTRGPAGAGIEPQKRAAQGLRVPVTQRRFRLGLQCGQGVTS